MSELLVNTIKKADGTGSLTVPAESGTVVTTASQSLGRRNLIINGAMQVAQRGNTSPSNGLYIADRFQYRASGLGAAGVALAGETQSTVVPNGFSTALKTNVTTAGSGFVADDRYAISYRLEHQDVTHLVDAGNTFTVSFWVRSSLATTYGFTIYLGSRDTTSTAEIYATTFTVNTADTWEKKTINIPAVTSSRSGGNDNDLGMQLYWGLEHISGGSRTSATADAWSDVSTSNQVTAAAADTGWLNSTNDFYITGVQLEVGSVATPFEHRSYGEELALCMRYYEITPVYAYAYHYNVSVNSNDRSGATFTYKVQKRTDPATSTYSGTTITSFHSICDKDGGGCYRTAGFNSPLAAKIEADAEL